MPRWIIFQRCGDGTWRVYSAVTAASPELAIDDLVRAVPSARGFDLWVAPDVAHRRPAIGSDESEFDRPPIRPRLRVIEGEGGAA